MNRFLIFFLISFIVHLAMGAVLLSRTGFFRGQGSQEEGSAEINETGTVPSEEEEPASIDPKSDSLLEPVEQTEPSTLINVSEPRAQEATAPVDKPLKKPPAPPPPPKPAEPKKNKALKQKTTKKLLDKPVTKKNTPPTETTNLKTEPVEGDSLEPQKAQDSPAESGPAPLDSDTESQTELAPPPPPSEKPEEAWEEDIEDRVLVASATKKTESEEWVDEGEILTPKQRATTQWVDAEEILPPEDPSVQPAIFKDPPVISYKEDLVQQAQLAPSPGNKAGSSPIPALDIGQARQHSQLKQLKGNPLPIYPEEALKKKWEGRAEIFYYVNPAGFVEKIQLKRSSGHSALDNSALRALARYRYHPGQEGWVRHPVEFFLEMGKEIKKTAPLGSRGLSESTSQEE